MIMIQLLIITIMITLIVVTIIVVQQKALELQSKVRRLHGHDLTCRDEFASRHDSNNNNNDNNNDNDNDNDSNNNNNNNPYLLAHRGGFNSGRWKHQRHKPLFRVIAQAD